MAAAEVQMPRTLESDYTTSYSSHYEGRIPAARIPSRPSSLTRMHSPQPRHVFLIRRAPNKPVCNAWTSPTITVDELARSSVDLARYSCTPDLTPKTLTCAKSSYTDTDGHPNFQNIPTRFGSNKLKMVPAKGMVPATSVWSDTTEPPIVDKPLNMYIHRKRRLNTPYVLNQQLTESDAMKDMKARTDSKDDCFSFVPRVSRKKHIQTLNSNLSGSSIAVRTKKKAANAKAAPRVAKMQWNTYKVEVCTPKPSWMYI